jgi:fructokinase
MFGAIEAGGTKFVCGVGTCPGDLQTTRIPTTTPQETTGRCLEFFARFAGRLSAIGIGSFGPVDLRPDSPTWGHITKTPKPGWSNTDLAGAIAKGTGVPVGFDTDVNAAALGESRWGAATDSRSCLYLTVGTGIGGGAMVDGQLVHGLVHPEMGHIRISRNAGDDFPGICPFHGDCLEGLASGPAVAARWGAPADQLPQDHPAWPLHARYLAVALANFLFVLSPEKIILGGGVMSQEFLFPMIRAELAGLLNGYIQAEAVLSGLDAYVVPPGLGDRSGILGALALAERAAR